MDGFLHYSADFIALSEVSFQTRPGLGVSALRIVTIRLHNGRVRPFHNPAYARIGLPAVEFSCAFYYHRLFSSGFYYAQRDYGRDSSFSVQTEHATTHSATRFQQDPSLSGSIFTCHRNLHRCSLSQHLMGPLLGMGSERGMGVDHPVHIHVPLTYPIPFRIRTPDLFPYLYDCCFFKRFNHLLRSKSHTRRHAQLCGVISDKPSKGFGHIKTFNHLCTPQYNIRRYYENNPNRNIPL